MTRSEYKSLALLFRGLRPKPIGGVSTEETNLVYDAKAVLWERIVLDISSYFSSYDVDFDKKEFLSLVYADR